MNQENTPHNDNQDQIVSQESEAMTSETAVTAKQETAPEAKPVEKASKKGGSKTEDQLLFEEALASLESLETQESTAGKLSKGDRIEASVIHVEKDRVFVDLGTKSEGVVPLAELSVKNIESAIGHVEVGDKIQVIVLRPEGREGNPIVSKKRADFESAWEGIVQSQRENKTVTALVLDRVKGGLVVDLGVKGFVPSTHVGSGKQRNLDKYIGQSIPLKIIEVDLERKKVVLSNKLAEEEIHGVAKDEIFSKVAIGDIVPGTVRRLTEYGAFVDLGGVDGLLHISEMSWARIDHPKEVLKTGQDIQVMILKLDASTGKISLGLRQVLPDPWNIIKDKYKIGDKIPAKINRVAQTGAFIRLEEGAEAFLPIGEISQKRIRKTTDVLTEGQELEFYILDLKPSERKMILSLKALGGIENITGVEIIEDDSPRPLVKKRRPGTTGFRSSDSIGRSSDKKAFGGRTSSVIGNTAGSTIGERLGALKDLMGFKEGVKSDDAELKKKKKAAAAPKRKNESFEDQLAEYEMEMKEIDDVEVGDHHEDSASNDGEAKA